ncbi:MAG TPA: helix-turn-helix domain-containing GNAT family N-acetyltransferase [Gemmatimonadales bacterium]|nr:helix-turn-helix domain-containing GNAT family N-acetyltransferase [Gemmatimonadales bacterium]
MAGDRGALERQIRRTRGFNRFYTRRIGVLEEGLLHSAFSLTEARLLFELAHRDTPDAAGLARDLGLDPGYLSRLLRGLRRRRLVTSHAVPGDRRRRRLALTETGRAAFAELDARSHADVGEMLRRLRPAERERLVEAMHTIERLLEAPPSGSVPVTLRPPEPGDLGWVVHRHGLLYAREYGWDARFEGLVAAVVAEFVRQLDPRRERAWIADQEGVVVGSVFLVRQSDEVAKLRLLLVEPEARGLGLGRRLVAECIAFARETGYRRITLWTNDVLHAARRIYQSAGFRLVKREPHRSFGEGLVGETWELEL